MPSCAGRLGHRQKSPHRLPLWLAPHHSAGRPDDANDDIIRRRFSPLAPIGSGHCRPLPAIAGRRRHENNTEGHEAMTGYRRRTWIASVFPVAPSNISASSASSTSRFAGFLFSGWHIWRSEDAPVERADEIRGHGCVSQLLSRLVMMIAAAFPPAPPPTTTS